MGIVSWLVVGLVAGWLTGKVMGAPGKGALTDVVIGLLGALACGLLVSLAARSEGDFVNTIVAASGAVVLTWFRRKLIACS